MSMESLPLLGFRVLGVDTKNSNPKFTGKYQVFHYTFLFNAYEVKRFQVFIPESVFVGTIQMITHYCWLFAFPL